MPQTEVNYISKIKGYVGSAAASGCLTRTAFNTTGDVLPFGQIVVFTGTGLNVALPSATGQKPAGVILRPNYYEDAQDEFDNDGVPSEGAIILGYQGLFWVNSETTGDINSPVFFRHTADGADTNIGAFRAAAGTGSDEISYPAARWMSDPVIGDVARLSLNLA